MRLPVFGNPLDEIVLARHDAHLRKPNCDLRPFKQLEWYET
jgi:hypothetical protein